MIVGVDNPIGPALSSITVFRIPITIFDTLAIASTEEFRTPPRIQASLNKAH